MRRLIIGDIHGQYNRMIDALSRSHYNPEKDELYPLGDFCDRGPNPIKVLDYIYSLPNCHPVIGNHDLYLMEYLSHTIPSYRLDNWLRQRNGGLITLKDVDKQSIEWQQNVLNRLLSTPFVRMLDSNIIVHGGISIELMNNHTPIDFINKTSSDISKKEYTDVYDELVWDEA
ncbi:MAG: fructose-bisphosphatase class III [Spirochaetales bacterium]|nr:fructose-bisphosphatase class III [Spirochaetales bacterium]